MRKSALIAAFLLLVSLVSFSQTPVVGRVGLLYEINSSQAPSAPTVTCAGACAGGTWGYKFVALDLYGNILGTSAQGTATNATTLTGTNKNTVSWTAIAGALTYNVYRTTTAGTPANLSLVCAGVTQAAGCVDDGSVNTATVTPGVFNGTGAAQTIYSFTMPPIPAGKGIAFRLIYICGTCTAVTHTFGVTFGATTVNWGGNSSATSSSSSMDGEIYNNVGVQTAQQIFLGPLFAGSAGVAGQQGNAAENTGSSVAVTFNYNAASGEIVTVKALRIWALP